MGCMDRPRGDQENLRKFPNVVQYRGLGGVGCHICICPAQGFFQVLVTGSSGASGELKPVLVLLDCI